MSSSPAKLSVSFILADANPAATNTVEVIDLDAVEFVPRTPAPTAPPAAVAIKTETTDTVLDAPAKAAIEVVDLEDAVMDAIEAIPTPATAPSTLLWSEPTPVVPVPETTDSYETVLLRARIKHLVSSYRRVAYIATSSDAPRKGMWSGVYNFVNGENVLDLTKIEYHLEGFDGHIKQFRDAIKTLRDLEFDGELIIRCHYGSVAARYYIPREGDGKKTFSAPPTCCGRHDELDEKQRSIYRYGPPDNLEKIKGKSTLPIVVLTPLRK